MALEIPIEEIALNPFNSRLRYANSNIQRIARSLDKQGQLVTVRVRMLSGKWKYQLIFGHRRLLAAKHLGWKTIRAEVIDVDDQTALEQSLVENFEHEDLSDYEKAIIFRRINLEFHKTFEEIGKCVGINRQHVSNYISMLDLFDSEQIKSDPSLLEALYCITEHHARVLRRVDDPKTRLNLIRMVCNDKLSVRDLSNVVGHLRSWFKYRDNEAPVNEKDVRQLIEKNRNDEAEEIARVVTNEFELPRKGDYTSFEKMHLYEDGFSLFSSFPPFERVEENTALDKERDWFFRVAPKLSWQMRNFKVKFVENVALATLDVHYSGSIKGRSMNMRVRGTVVLVKRKKSWKILHEHWSGLQDNQELLKKIEQLSIAELR